MRNNSKLNGILPVFSLVLGLLLLMPVAEAATATTARPAEWAVRVGTASNLFRITPSLYRSAQLGKNDLPELRSLGIKTVVNLRALHSDEDWLEHSDIHSQRVRINTWSIDDDDVVAALSAIRRAEQDGPVLLHCWHGADRTGLVSALYRILYQNWTKAQALDELLHGGYGYHAIWKNIPEYLNQVDIEKLRNRLNKS